MLDQQPAEKREYIGTNESRCRSRGPVGWRGHTRRKETERAKVNAKAANVREWRGGGVGCELRAPRG